MVDFLKIVAIAIMWIVLFLYWGLVIIAALESFSLSVILYIIYGVFVTAIGIVYSYWVRSI